MRVIFLGTPEFAVPSLEALIESGRDVIAVFTQPDRPKGRGNQLAESPVKRAAARLGVTVHQPERLRRSAAFDLLKELSPDLMVVVGYGQILPQQIIDLPKYGILNVHASLLPKYRGAAPIQWAIANGESETGVTIMQIDAGLDTGDMLLKAKTHIPADETAPELSARLAPMGAKLLIEAMDAIENGMLLPEKQNDAEATYAPILHKEDGRVDWRRPASQIHNRMRGFTPWPGAFTEFRAQPLLILEARPFEGSPAAPGELRIENRRILAGCGEQTGLQLLEVQPAGKKRMSAEAFLNGYKLANGELLGSRN